MAGTQPQLELCAGAYRARQTAGSLVIFAEGIHPSSGFNTFLSCETASPDLPIFSLWHVPPSGPVMQVATPFSVWCAFQTLRTVSRALVKDTNGTHEIPVEGAAGVVRTDRGPLSF
jgi:hypothetical protein